MTKFGGTKLGVPLKWGCQNLKFLSTHARQMKFLG